MKTALYGKLMATSAATVLAATLMSMPASAQQGQMRGEGRGAIQSNDNVRGGGEMRRGGEMRGGREMRGSDARGNRAERAPRAQTRTNVRGEANVRTRRDDRVRANVNANVRGDIRGERRQAWRDDARWRDDDWRFRDRTRVRVGVGFGAPYYGSYGYDDGYGYSEPEYYESYAAAPRTYVDGYYSYGAAPRAYVETGPRTYVEGYDSYAASPGCTCAPTPYAAYRDDWGWNRAGWGVQVGW